MTTFTLDTSGSVRLPGKDPALSRDRHWAHLTPFAQGYVEAMFAEIARKCPSRRFARLQRAKSYGWSVALGFSDLAPATLARIMADCAAWRTLYPNTNQGEAGGASFWRLRTEQIVERPDFPPQAPYLGEDGLVYLRETA